MKDSNFAEVLLTIDNIEEKSKKKKKYIASKLHKQFGHPTSARLSDLIKTAEISGLLDIVKDLDKNCEICMRYKGTSSRPLVGFSLAHDFNENETIAMDLKQFRGAYILHMVDHATRYSAAAIVSSKQKKVIDKIFKHWIAIFGTPNLFLSDKEEFNNELFREMGKQLNINIKTTAAESPWSNSIVEKQNGVIGNMMKYPAHGRPCNKIQSCSHCPFKTKESY